MRFNASVVIAAVAIVTGLVTSAPARPDSTENQVRAVLYTMNTSYNRSDFGDFASHLCAEMLQAAGFAAGWYESRKIDGPTRITVNSVQIRGDEAIANVGFEAAKHADTKTLDIEFLREGAEWKACRYLTGQTV